MTGNIPLESKSSTITNSFLKYSTFINSNCSKKDELAKQFGIDYVYSSEFSCKNFNLVGSGTEGLFLYSYKSS